MPDISPIQQVPDLRTQLAEREWLADELYAGIGGFLQRSPVGRRYRAPHNGILVKL